MPTEQGHIVIAHMVNGAPAALSGLLNIGDQVLAIDGVQVHGMPVPEIIRLVLGPSGSAVHLDFIPVGTDQRRQVEIWRSSPGDPRPARTPR